MRYVFVALSMLFFTSGWTQVKYVNEFLNIGVGGRGHGMFGSTVASVDDASSGYWNPAGLAHMHGGIELQGMHTPWFGGVANYDYISVAKGFSGEKSSGISLSLIRMAIDDIPNTLNLIAPDGTIDYNSITSFSAADYGGLLSYGKALSSKWSIGGGVKVIHRRIGSFGNSWGFGADLGLQYWGSRLKLGFMFRDITTTYNTWSFNLSEEEKAVFVKTGNEIPSSSVESTLPRLVIGAGYLIGNPEKFNVYLESNAILSTDGRKSGIIDNADFAIDPTVGIEIGYGGIVYIRGGLGNIQRLVNSTNFTERNYEFQPNVGIGINLKNISIDYALANIGSTSSVNQSHIFSLTLRLAPPKNKQKVADTEAVEID